MEEAPYPDILDIARFDGLAFTLFAVVAVSTVLRLLTRGYYLRAFGADDVTSVAATVCCQLESIIPWREKLIVPSDSSGRIYSRQPC